MGSLLEYIEEENEIGKIEVPSSVMKEINKVMYDITDEYYYIPSKGVLYAMNFEMTVMAMVKSDAFKIKDAGKLVMKIGAETMGRYLSYSKKEYVKIKLFKEASVVEGKLTGIFKVYPVEEKVRFITASKIMKGRDYIKVSTKSDKFIEGVNWVCGTGNLKHYKVEFILDGSTFKLYDRDFVGKDKKKQSVDEASANIANVVGDFKTKVSLQCEYAKKVLRLIGMSETVDVYISTDEMPVIFKGKFDYEDNKTKKKFKFKYEAMVAPFKQM